MAAAFLNLSGVVMTPVSLNHGLYTGVALNLRLRNMRLVSAYRYKDSGPILSPP